MLDGCPGKIGCVRFQPRNRVKEGALPAIRLADEYDIWITIFFAQLFRP